MIDWFIHTDQDLFFFLNGLHQDWLDPIMYWISDKLIWIPFYLFLAYLMIRQYGWKSTVWLVAIGLTIAATDQFCSGFLKSYFERYRPSRDPAFADKVYIINGYTGGRYGFASSHAGNAFALATFIFLLFKNQYKKVWAIFIWAGLVSFSRIYLGVHYPGDIIVGGIIGALFAILFYRIALYVYNKRVRVQPPDSSKPPDG